MNLRAVPARSSVSFRDPQGRLFLLKDRVLRLINGPGAEELRRFLTTDAAREFTASGRLVNTKFIDPLLEPSAFHCCYPESSTYVSEETILVEHERIRLRSFPYEWPPEMLHAAGGLMLELAEAVLRDGYSLKDATPYNILFCGPRPIFVDLLSFESRDPNDPTWLPFNQFVRTILLPLLANKYFGLRLDQLLTVNRDGLGPAEVVQLGGSLRKFSPLFLSLVSIPHWLSTKQFENGDRVYRPNRLKNSAQAGFILERQFRRLRRLLKKVEPRSKPGSAWSNYMRPNKFFAAEYLAAKKGFVEHAFDEFRPRRVLDVGCNTGYFSRLAASCGASVVAIDQDPAVVGEVWRQAFHEDLDILPLVVNIARPTAAFGWRNEEWPSFLERARGGFDACLMLAVLHHLLVTEQIPLPAILELAAELTNDLLIVEFVDREDPLFRRLVRGREQLFSELTRESFEATASEWFEFARTEQLHQSRWLYLLRKRSAIHGCVSN